MKEPQYKPKLPDDHPDRIAYQRVNDRFVGLAKNFIGNDPSLPETVANRISPEVVAMWKRLDVQRKQVLHALYGGNYTEATDGVTLMIQNIEQTEVRIRQKLEVLMPQ